MGNSASTSEEEFNSTQIQRVYNESVVKMAQNCDSRVGNTVTITITGDNNQINNLWVSQDINWSVECVSDFFNSREYYNELTAGLEDLASTAQKEIGILGGIITLPVPNFATDTTVNTNQIQETTTRLYSAFNQDCSTEIQNEMNFDINGNYNTAEGIVVEQVVDGMNECYFSATNQEKVVNDLQATVKGNTDVGISIFGWIIIIVIIIVVLIVLIVIIVAIVRAARGGGDKKNGGQMEGYQGESNPYAGGNYGEGQMGYAGGGYGLEGQIGYEGGGYPGGAGYPPAGY